MIEDLVTAQWQVMRMDTIENVDSQWDYWKLFNDIVDLHVPMKKARVHSKSLPWISREIQVLIDEG